MSRLFVILLSCFFTFNSLKAQNSTSQINLALLNFDLTNNKLALEDQELFLSTLLSLGDNAIVLEEIIRKILVTPDICSNDSLLNSMLNDFNPQDSVIINQYPRTVADWRDEPWHTVRLAYMGQAFLDSISLSEAYLKIHIDLPSNFPNIPTEPLKYNNLILSLIDKIRSHVLWAINYPKEYQYFIDLLRLQTKRCFKNDTDDLVLNFVNRVKNVAIESKSVDRESIPAPLNNILNYYYNQKKVQLKFADQCNPQNIKLFLENAYQLIYQKPIPDATALKINKYIVDQNLYDAEMIYLALILNKYE
jgi:hypothetical protein